MKGSTRSTLGYLGNIPCLRLLAQEADPIFCRLAFFKLTPQVSLRSALAFLLIILSSLPALLPLYNSSESSLPACCRRDGKHRCMMTLKAMAGPFESGQSFRNASPDCPYRSHPSHLRSVKGGPRDSSSSIGLSATGIAKYDHCLVLISFSGSHTPSRGPPAVAHRFGA
jgi:hypothetical protein